MNSPIPQIVVEGHSVYSAPQIDGCSQIFSGCYDPNCERPCGAHRPYSARAVEINLDIKSTVHPIGFWTLAAITLALTIIFTGAAAYGLSAEERAYQSDHV